MWGAGGDSVSRSVCRLHMGGQDGGGAWQGGDGMRSRNGENNLKSQVGRQWGGLEGTLAVGCLLGLRKGEKRSTLSGGRCLWGGEFRKKHVLLQQSVNHPPYHKNHPFVSQDDCTGIRVRGRWTTFMSCHPQHLDNKNVLGRHRSGESQS